MLKAKINGVVETTIQATIKYFAMSQQISTEGNCCTFKNKSGNIIDKRNVNVRDPCFYTDRYRGGVHDVCNVRYCNSKLQELNS